MQAHFALVLALLVGMVLTFPTQATAVQQFSSMPNAACKGEVVAQSAPLKVIRLQGSYRQMGRQYGHLLKKELKQLYEEGVEKELMAKMGFSHERLLHTGRLLFDRYPKRYKEILLGMAETSGLGIQKQIILNGFEMHPKFGPPPTARCTGMAVWGDYTGGGPLIFARYNDDSSFYKDFSRFLTVAVFNANDGTLPTAIINYAGVIYAPNGMNSEGIFLEINSGDSPGYYPDRLFIPVSLFSFLQDYSTMAGIGAALKSTLSDLSSIINVADQSSACSFECPTFGARQRAPDKDGLLVSTNHFLDPFWNLPPPNDEQNAWTITRRTNLLALGELYKGQFNVEKMKEILDLNVNEGGATSPTSPTVSTIYQIVAVPERRILWIRAMDQTPWQQVDLKSLFRRSH